MPAPIIDTHSHIHFEEYDADRDEVIVRARRAGVKMIAIGTDVEESKKAIAVAEKYPDDVLGATIGFHPTYDAALFHRDELKPLAEHRRVVAIGECGLDYYRIADLEAQKKQRELFEAQIELAAKLKKPLVIHCRDAHPDLRAILKANSHKLKADQAGVMHFFGGTGAWENAHEYLRMGFYISFAGVVTFKTYTHADDIRRLPSDRILVETDAPYVAPVPHRGERNEPAYIEETVKHIARIRSVDAYALREALFENTRNLFGV